MHSLNQEAPATSDGTPFDRAEKLDRRVARLDDKVDVEGRRSPRKWPETTVSKLSIRGPRTDRRLDRRNSLAMGSRACPVLPDFRSLIR